MTRYTVSILEEHRAKLKQTLFRDESEYGALLLCGRSRHIDPWTHEVEERFLVREIIEVDEDAFLERTPTSMTWSTTPFFRALKRAEPKNFALAVAHSHPSGSLAFSNKDDIADKEIFQIAFDRLESTRPHLSIVMDSAGELVARAYESDLKPMPVSMIRIIGDRWNVRYHGRGHGRTAEEFDRQVRAFGSASTEDISSLRIGIVGCGGTGSAVASMLARVGVRHLALFDIDSVDATNLNRMHFSTRADANLGRKKVDVVGEGVAKIGLPISVVRYPCFVNDPICRDALCSCDIVFGCTDDHLGRNFLNHLSHFYFVPIIDLGVLIEPNKTGGYDVFDGRVTVVQPGYPCQLCRGLIQVNEMQSEDLRRRDPVLYHQYRRAGYVAGAPDPSPVVVTFTTEVAAMAINELFHRFNGFRGEEGHCSERVRRLYEVKDADTVPGGAAKLGCGLCYDRKYDGRGDMEPFLNLAP